MSRADSSLHGRDAGGRSESQAFSFFVVLAALAVLLLSIGSPASAGQVRRSTQLTTQVASVPHRIEIDGINFGGGDVSLGSEITAELEVVAYSDGATGAARLRTAGATYHELIVTGPLPVPSDVADWFDQHIEGRGETRDGNIVIMDRNGEEMAQ